MIQHPHADHARLHNHYKIDETNKKEKCEVGFELNCEKYNQLVNDNHPISSIMIDLSPDRSGFFWLSRRLM